MTGVEEEPVNLRISMGSGSYSFQLKVGTDGMGNALNESRLTTSDPLIYNMSGQVVGHHEFPLRRNIYVKRGKKWAYVK